MKTKALSLDTRNANNRVYPKSVMEAAIKKAQHQIENDRFFVTYRPPESSTVNIMDVTGMVNKLYIENDELMADIKFLDAPNSLHAEIAVQKGKLHVRLAGIGSIQMIDGVAHVQNDYELICCFLTDNPA